MAVKVVLLIMSALALLLGASAFVTPVKPSSFGGSALVAPKFDAPPRAAPQSSTLVMRARNCDLTGARPNRNHRLVSKSHVRTKSVQHLNLQKKRFWWEEGKRTVTMRITCKALRTIKKLGLQKAANKYGVNLSKFRV
uniref:Large ribosomal subunit protein bL28c n=1 Tax=Fibrocapsa japonica TaxID=94617 RepID=A0A7S2Y1A0_9STRA|mmetsp:Transcript_7844/g.11955  ORF Transcript_7844/g.11955 Transcript_7844/m.11955 type:complete len:138 (+) Transcript_7844:108-521(+)|eukprot:CAMPEP_0113934588 /NCGR_PEP_ID=MMETSP1339-20121228/1902_1 /TAXON_ID=94617 /ORGANISM="Fibrocapsa japonica" /LENGTH=137 /DNA_ID=CAMNT_0000936453 /DNA_START=101 /DNA_END=514 /DNA_ORIENTATION=+ /assembly_acc=CAM_ASM_000762